MTALLVLMALAILGLGLLNLWQARHYTNSLWLYTRARLLIEQAAATNRKTERVGRKVDETLDEIHSHYLHFDPCDDTACPCRKAEADHWRDQGLARP